MPSNGTTGVSTSGDAVVAALAADPRTSIAFVSVNNTGNVPGFVSFEVGSNGNPEWHYITGPGTLPFNLLHRPRTSPAVSIKRIAGGSDVTGVYVSTW